MRQTAILAIQAGIGDPLDPHPVAHLDILFRASTKRNNHTSPLVSADEWKLGGCRPVALQSVQVRMTHARV